MGGLNCNVSTVVKHNYILVGMKVILWYSTKLSVAIIRSDYLVCLFVCLFVRLMVNVKAIIDHDATYGFEVRILHTTLLCCWSYQTTVE